MRKMRLFCIMLLTVSVMSATNTMKSNNPDKGVMKEIAELLKNPNVEFDMDSNATVLLQFTHDNRIIVLSVEGVSEEIATYIKMRLDNRGVNENKLSKTKIYSLPIKLIKRS